MKTKDETFNMSKRWFAEVADLRAKYPLLVLVRDNSGENSSKDINDFFTENSVKNYFSTPYEQWQNGLAEASVGSVSMLGKTWMSESGLGGPYWFCSTQNGVNCRNVTFKERLGTTPYEKTYGIKKDVSRFKPFGCLAYMHLNKDRRDSDRGRHAPKAVEAVNLGFGLDSNTSGYNLKLLIEGTGKILISNHWQVRNMVYKHLSELEDIDVLTVDNGVG